MKNDQNELFKFIKSISVGLKQYSVRELTIAMKQVLKGTNSSELEFVNQAVCSHYSISHKTFKTEKTHGNRTDARHVVFCILFLNLGYLRFQFQDLIMFPEELFKLHCAGSVILM